MYFPHRTVGHQIGTAARQPSRSRPHRAAVTVAALVTFGLPVLLAGCTPGSPQAGAKVPGGSGSWAPSSDPTASQSPSSLPSSVASSPAAESSSSPAKKPTSPAAGQQTGPAQATPVSTGLSNTACDKAEKKAATSQSGPAPVQFANGWDAAPVQGCSYTDSMGRTVNLSAEENRMLYRVNEMRSVQDAKDHQGRKQLLPDFCLYQFARKYIATRPSGHSPMTLKMYPFGNGSGSGSSWIGENYGSNGGQSNDKFALVDIRVYGWFTSGTLTTGHYGNIMNPQWTSTGMGILSGSGSIVSTQNFAANWAMWTDVDGSKCSTPPTPLSKNATLPPIGYWPGV